MPLRQLITEKKRHLEAVDELKKAIEESRKCNVVAFKNTEALLKEIRKYHSLKKAHHPKETIQIL